MDSSNEKVCPDSRQLYETKSPWTTCSRDTPNNLPSLTFHNVHGEGIALSSNDSVARRNRVWGSSVAFSARPVRVDEKVYIRVLEVSNVWRGFGGISVGFTSHDPATVAQPLLEGYSLLYLADKQGYWAKALEENVSYCEDYTICYHVNSAGEVHFETNGEDRGVFVSGVDTSSPLWALVGVSGKCTAVRLSGHQNPAAPVGLPTSEGLRAPTPPQQGASADAHSENDNDLLLASTDVEAHAMSAANAAEPEVQLAAVQRCCTLLASGPATHSHELISRGVLPALVQCLSRADSPSLQHYAASALASAAMGPAQTERVVQAGAVPQLLHLLTSPHQQVCEQAVRALGNMMGHKLALKSTVIELLGVVQPLLRVIKPEIPSSLLYRALCVISNICRRCLRLQMFFSSSIQDILLTLNVVITHTDMTVLCETVRAVNFLTRDPEHTELMIDSGMMAQLVRLLSHKEVAVQTAAVEAVRNITGSTLEHRQPLLDCDALSHFTALLSHQNLEIRTHALGALANIMCINQHAVQPVIDAGLLPNIVENLSKGPLETQREAVRAVNSLAACGTDEQVAALIQCGVLPRLRSLLDCEDTDVASKKQIRIFALEALVNIMNSDHHAVQAVIDAGLLPNIVANLSKGPLETQREAVGAVFNLAARGNDEQKAALIQCGVLPRLRNLLDCEDTDVASKKEIRKFALGALANMLSGHHAVQAVIDAGLLPDIVENLSKGPLETQREAVRAVKSLAARGTEEQKAALIQCGVLPRLRSLLDCEDTDVASKKQIRIFALEALVNIMNSDHHAVQAVIDAGLLPNIVANLSKGPLETQREAVGAVFNLAARGNDEQKAALIQCGVLPRLRNLLDCEDTDVASKKEIRKFALGALANMLSGHHAVQAVIDAGLLPDIVENLSKGPLETQREAVRAVKSLAARGTEEQKAALIQCGVLPRLRSLLDCEDTDVASKKQIRIFALEALVNIMNSDHHAVQAVIDAGLLPNIVANLSKGPLETQREAVGAVFNLAARGNDEQKAALIQCGVLPRLRNLLDCEDTDVASKKEIRKFALGALANMLSGHHAVQAVIDAGLLPDIVENLSKGPLETQREAVRAVKSLAARGTEEQKAALIQCGVLPRLRSLLDCEDTDVASKKEIRIFALGALAHIMRSGDHAVQAVIDAGLLPNIVANLSKGPLETQLKAVRAVINLTASDTDEQVAALIQCGVLPPLRSLLDCEDTDVASKKKIRELALKALAIIMKSGHHAVQAVIDAGLLPNIVENLSKGPLETQHAAVGAVINLAANGTDEQVAALIQCGVLPRLRSLLDCEDTDVASKKEIRELALKALAIIMKSGHHAVQAVIDAGLLPNIVENLSKGPLETQHAAVGAVINLAANGTDEQVAALIQCGVLPRLRSLLDCEDTDVASKKQIRIFALEALVNIMNSDHHAVQAVIDAGLLPIIVANLSKGPLETQREAVGAVINLAARGNDEQKAALIQCGVLPRLRNLLDCEDTDVASNVEKRSQALGTLVNIMLSGHHEVQAVIDAGLLPNIVENLSKGPLETQRKAVQAVHHLTACGTEEQKAVLVQCSALPLLCSLLDCEDPDAVSEVLECLGNLLKKAGPGHGSVEQVAALIQQCGGVERIKRLQEHEDGQIHEKAQEIIDNYLAGEYKTDQQESMRDDNKPSTSRAGPHPATGEALPSPECMICCNNPIDSVFNECGHMCMCYTCAVEQWLDKGGGRCPLCRAHIKTVILTYRS